MKRTVTQFERVTIEYAPVEREEAFARVQTKDRWHITCCGPHGGGKRLLIAERPLLKASTR